MELFSIFGIDRDIMEDETKKTEKKKTEKIVGGWEQEIKLPIDIRHFDCVITLNPCDFNDNEIVTLETIRAKLENQFPELEREKCNLIYYKDKNFLVPVLKNGERKG